MLPKIDEAKSAPDGASVDIGAKLVRTTDNAPLTGKTVDVYDSTGTVLKGTFTTDANGRASLSVTAPAKGTTVKCIVKFAGDANYNPSSGTISVKGT